MRKRTLAGVMLAASAITTPLSAAQPLPTNPNILTTVQQIQAAVQQLQTSLNNQTTGLQSAFTNLQQTLSSIQSSLNNLQPPPVSNVRNTPPVQVTTGTGFNCLALNTSTTPKKIMVEIINANGESIFPLLDGKTPLAPGAIGGGVTALNTQAISCRFTVLDGNRNDVRGVLQHFLTDGVNGPVISVTYSVAE